MTSSNNFFFGLTFTIFSQSKQIQHHVWGYYEKIIEIVLFLSPKNILSEEELENEYKDNMFYTFEYKGKKYKMTNSYLKEFKTGYVIWNNNKFLGILGASNTFEVYFSQSRGSAMNIEKNATSVFTYFGGFKVI